MPLPRRFRSGWLRSAFSGMTSQPAVPCIDRSSTSYKRPENQKKDMLCWICGEPADTGEHLIKATDVREIFPHITTHTPLHRRKGVEPPNIVQGVQSSKLKFQSRLCGECNNERTQPHDKSWEALATFLRNRIPAIESGDVVDPAEAFQAGFRPGMLGVHLFFAKHFGCLIGDSDAPIDRSVLADAILNTKPIPHLYLSFIAIKTPGLAAEAIVTPLCTISLADVQATTYHYFVGRIAVQVVLAPCIERNINKLQLWNPADGIESITLG
jgi:hypothetical protein